MTDNLWIAVVALLFFLGTFARRWWGRREAATVTIDSSVILSGYTLNAELTKLSEGKLGDYPYDIMITEPIIPTFNTVQTSAYGQNMIGDAVGEAVQVHEAEALAGRIILIVKLPVASPVHIAGLGLQDNLIAESIGKMGFDKILSRTELEGDFPDYFRLYCTKGYDIELREILDPTVMQFLKDCCQRTHWELFEDSIYFSEMEQPSKSISNGSEHDNTNLVQDALTFVDKVLPVLRQMEQSSKAS